MIYGIGIDIVRIQRVREAVEQWGEKFLLRIYTSEEISYCYKRKNPYRSLAARFAAKEAFIKAAGSGIPLSLKDIEVTHRDSGQPFLLVQGIVDDLFKARHIKKSHLSISHEQDYAVACVVLEY